MSPINLVHACADVGEARIHYVTAGTGEPIVLLHGFPQTWYAWRHVIPILAERYTVIAADLRGLGDSSKPTAGYDKCTAAHDIHELVKSLGYKRVRLVGHDIGGWVAYPFAAMYPESVERLVLLQSLVPGFGLEKNFQKSWHFNFHMATDIAVALVSGRERMYLDRFISDGIYDRSAVSSEALDEYVRSYSMPGALRAAFSYYRELPRDAEDNARLARTMLRMPVLALGGEIAEKDNMLESAQLVAQDVRGGTVARCGHWIPEERPDRLARLMLEFFE